MKQKILKFKIDILLLSSYLMLLILAIKDVFELNNIELYLSVIYFAIIGYKIFDTSDEGKLKFRVFIQICLLITVWYLI